MIFHFSFLSSSTFYKGEDFLIFQRKKCSAMKTILLSCCEIDKSLHIAWQQVLLYFDNNKFGCLKFFKIFWNVVVSQVFLLSKVFFSNFLFFRWTTVSFFPPTTGNSLAFKSLKKLLIFLFLLITKKNIVIFWNICFQLIY
jgi:hypothetical protein